MLTQSRSKTQDHCYWFAHRKLHVEQTVSTAQLSQSLPMVVGKAHGHHVDNVLHSVPYL